MELLQHGQHRRRHFLQRRHEVELHYTRPDQSCCHLQVEDHHEDVGVAGERPSARIPDITHLNKLVNILNVRIENIIMFNVQELVYI